MPIAPGHPKDWNQRVFNYLKVFPPKDNLETFKKNLTRMNKMSPNKHYEIREIKPPHDGISYACTYDIHTMVSKPPMKSSFARIEQYWDVDGNCIGFSFQGQQFMFPAKSTADNKTEKPILKSQQWIQDILRTVFSNRAEVLAQVPKGSELEKFIEQYPHARINIQTDKNEKIRGFDVIYDTHMGQVGRREPYGILYGEMIESHATFDANGSLVGKSEQTRDAGIKSANFKSASDKVVTKNKTTTSSRLKKIERE